MSFYNAIMNTEEIPESLKKYVATIEKLKSGAPGNGQIMPDICWITNAPIQNTVSMLCGYFAESGLIEFSGELRYIQIRIDDPVHSVPAICAKIKDLLSLAAGYHGSFKGVILVDMVSLRNFNDKHTAIMRYIKSNTPGCLRIITSDVNEHKISDVENMLYLASYNIRTIRGDSLSADQAITVFQKRMESGGFKFDAEAVDTIHDMIGRLTESHRINNTEDVNDLCNDMSFFLMGENWEGNISDRMTNIYFSQSALCADRKNEKRKIGFSGSKEV